MRICNCSRDSLVAKVRELDPPTLSASARTPGQVVIDRLTKVAHFIWVVVDRLTKVVYFIPVKTTYSHASS
jgi:hypothetical protein